MAVQGLIDKLPQYLEGYAHQQHPGPWIYAELEQPIAVFGEAKVYRLMLMSVEGLLALKDEYPPNDPRREALVKVAVFVSHTLSK